MRRHLVAVAALGLALALPSAAAAKGPASASISGPGLDRNLAVRGQGEMGPGTPLGMLVDQGGFFAQMYGQTPKPTLATRPKGTLGPRYRIVYVVPGPNSTESRVVQLFYPFATPVPLTYMKPGQSFWSTRQTVGGWYRGTGRLKAMLVRAGLPRSGAPERDYVALVIRLIVRLAPRDIPALADVTLDGRVLLFAAALATLVAVVIGVVPAWHRSGKHSGLALRAARGQAGGVLHHRARTTLVVGELAVALILLAGAGLLVRSFTRLLETSPGFNADRAAVVQVFASRGKTPPQLATFFEQVIERMRSLPEVTSVGAVLAMPFIESNVGMKTPVTIAGRAEPAAGDEHDAFISVATPGYFQTMQIPLLEGRMFERFDRMGSLPVAIVSETFARREFPSESPLNRRITYQFEGRMLDAEIVGVVGDVRHDGLDRPARTEIFVPHAQVPYTAMTFVARTTQDPASSLRALRAQVHAVDPTQPIYRAATVSELVDRSLTDRRFVLALLAVFATLAVALAAAGVYGVISVLTLQRTREFGVRLALGAAPLEILGIVVRQGGAIALLGLGIGLGMALIVGRVMKGFLYGVTPADPITLTGVVVILAGVALLACAVPAMRAARVDTVVALRSE